MKTGMDDLPGLTSAPLRAVPIVFGAEPTRCFGWFHAAQGTQQGMGVVLCRPVGYEGTCAYETYTEMAEKLARAGFAVIRFDYHGTGDSAGNDTDPDRVRAWVESTKSAIEEVKRLGGVSRLALFGVRLGATLAVTAAVECGGVDSLVMWAPCLTGRAFARELRVSRSRPADAVDGKADEGFEALGYAYSAQTLQDLQSLDCQRLQVPPARRLLLVGRDDLPIEGPLPASYRKMGIDTTYTVLPGYANLIVEPHEGVVAHETLNTIVDWLLAGNDTLAAPAIPVAPPVSAPIQYPAAPDSAFDGIREVGLQFGEKQNLFGILSEPADLTANDRRFETVVLMLNVGTNYRIGPNRMYVKMARSWTAQGYRTLRFDFAGIGDSRNADRYTRERMYSRESIAEVQAAIDCLALRGCKRFILMGLCSGAYAAFQSALAEPRVGGLILLNPRRLEWKVGETLQSAMQVSFKSTHFYRKALLDPDVYKRILFGQVDMRGIAGRMGMLLLARLRRLVVKFSRALPDEDDVLANAKLLCSEGKDLLLILGAEDDGRDYIEFHFGLRGKYMCGTPHFKMCVLEDADHTFSISSSQQTVIDLIQQQLNASRVTPQS